MASQTNKRRRTNDTITQISDLPVGILVDVSAYLSKPSRAILAVAFSAPSSSWQNINKYLMHRPSPISTAIVSSSEWDTLDLVDVEKSLASRLSDDDMFAMLVCINAQDVLKKLKLTGCINITGCGLSPLRGSVVLEQIDLSLLKQHENPDDTPKVQHVLIKEVVLPILDSIISSTGCVLKHIQLAHSWKEEDDDGPLHEFANRYDQYQENRGISCSGCTKRIRAIPWFRATNMLHYNTCYDCLKHYCEECSDHDDGASPLNFCFTCKKDYCKDCDTDRRGKYAKCTGCTKHFKAEIASLF